MREEERYVRKEATGRNEGYNLQDPGHRYVCGGSGGRGEDQLAGGYREQYYYPLVARIWEDTKILETSIARGSYTRLTRTDEGRGTGRRDDQCGQVLHSA